MSKEKDRGAEGAEKLGDDAPAGDSVLKKKRGRPKGSRNKTTPAAKEPKERKSASSKKHPGKAAERSYKQYLDNLNEENKRRKEAGLKPLPVAVTPDDDEPAPKYPLDQCEQLVRGSMGVLGTLLAVEDVQPKEEHIAMFANGLHGCSAYWDFLHPKYIALITLGSGATMCVAPVIRERVRRNQAADDGGGPPAKGKPDGENAKEDEGDEEGTA